MIVSIKAGNVTLNGFKIQHSGYATLEDPAGIKIYDSNNVTIENNIIDDTFFGIYAQYAKNCIIKNNKLTAYGKQEQEIGNGIHCWKSDSLQIIGNTIRGHRDGIYFEFVTNSLSGETMLTICDMVCICSRTWFLHHNIFSGNGAGVAVCIHMV
jgi:nitrous oxidase accessory protein